MLAKYKYLAMVLIALAVLSATYFKGKHDVQVKWDLANAITKKEIAELKTKAAEVTIKEVIKYVDRVKTVRIKGDTITKFVDRYITVESDKNCIIPKNFILLHDSAAKNVVPKEVPSK